MDTKLISFANLKGGALKSTHAAALAASLLDHGKTVHVLELDEQGSLEDWANLIGETNPNITNSFLDLSDATLEDAHDAILKVCINVDYVIADTPGSAATSVAAALVTSDVVFVPLQLTKLDIDGAYRTHELLLKSLEELGASSEGFDNFCLLDMKDQSFPSKKRLEKEKSLSKDFHIRNGLPRSSILPEWMEMGVTPKQLAKAFTDLPDGKNRRVSDMAEKSAMRAITLIENYFESVKDTIDA